MTDNHPGGIGFSFDGACDIEVLFVALSCVTVEFSCTV